MILTKVGMYGLGILAVVALVIWAEEQAPVWVGASVSLFIGSLAFGAADRAITLLAEIKDRLPAPKSVQKAKADPVDEIPHQFRS